MEIASASAAALCDLAQRNGKGGAAQGFEQLRVLRVVTAHVVDDAGMLLLRAGRQLLHFFRAELFGVLRRQLRRLSALAAAGRTGAATEQAAQQAAQSA